MSLGPQYTSCVEAKDFEPLSKAYVAVLLIAAAGGAIAALFSGGIGLIIAMRLPHEHFRSRSPKRVECDSRKGYPT